MREGVNILSPVLRWKFLGVFLYNLLLCIPLIVLSIGINDLYPLLFVIAFFAIRVVIINAILTKRLFTVLKDRLALAFVDTIIIHQIFLAIKDLYVLTIYSNIED